MKRASALPAYHDLADFEAPPGVTEVEIDPTSLQLATPACPGTRKEVFITGTEPTEFCELHGGRMLTQTPPLSWLSRSFGGGEKSESDPAETTPASTVSASSTSSAPAPVTLPTKAAAPKPIAKATPPRPAPPSADDGKDKKESLLQKFFGIFGGKKDDQDSQNSPKSSGH